MNREKDMPVIFTIDSDGNSIVADSWGRVSFWHHREVQISEGIWDNVGELSGISIYLSKNKDLDRFVLDRLGPCPSSEQYELDDYPEIKEYVEKLVNINSL